MKIKHMLFCTMACLIFLQAGCASKQPKPRVLWPIDNPKLEWLGNFQNKSHFPDSGSGLMSKIVGEDMAIEFSQPFDIASDGAGSVYVTDVALKNIVTFDFNTKKVNHLLETGVVGRPMGIDLDNDGRIYVSDSTDGNIKIFSKDGRYLSKISNKEHLSRPTYLAINNTTERIYISDPDNNHVAVFDLEGRHLFNLGEDSESKNRFHNPSGIAVSNTGDVYVADLFNSRIQVFDGNGKRIRMFGELGDHISNFEHPKDLAVDSDGNLHIVDDRKGMMLTYTPEGKLLLVSGGSIRKNPSLGMSSPKGIFIDKNDKIFIADFVMKRFSMYQFLSEKILQANPTPQADIDYLQEYLKRAAEEKKR